MNAALQVPTIPNRTRIPQAATICRNIQYRFGLDLIVCKPQCLAQRLEWGDSFLKEVVGKWVILYESADA